jgi:hypothetical protein
MQTWETAFHSLLTSKINEFKSLPLNKRLNVASDLKALMSRLIEARKVETKLPKDARLVSSNTLEVITILNHSRTYASGSYPIWKTKIWFEKR